MRTLIEENNRYASTLHDEQIRAKEALRLDEVKRFADDIGYKARSQRIEELKEDAEEKKGKLEEAEKEVTKKQNRVNLLRSRLGNESLAAQKVNELLGGYFEQRSLSLEAVRDGGDSTCKFRIVRNEGQQVELAYNLSEGERNLIAFCYFIAKLKDAETQDVKPIIWVDDPVSSLDSNHMFFVSSLIDEEVVRLDAYEQLFVATHSLDFLRCLKYISKDYRGKDKEKLREFFIVRREGETSTIEPMPTHMKKHISEFNYLFEQIYRCAYSDENNDSDIFYNFGNNARKFLEIFLYYMYPDASDLKTKVDRFFGDDKLHHAMTYRINNEYSHGNIERGPSPIDGGCELQMRGEARAILERIKQANPDQYDALERSIEGKNS